MIDRDREGLSIQHQALDDMRLGQGVTHFVVSSPRVLEDLAPGDEVDFDTRRDSHGALVVSDVVEMGQ